MTGPFAVALDSNGNLYMQEGTVIGLHGTTVYFQVGGTGIGVAMVDPGLPFVQASESAGGFYGGSGINVAADTSVLGTLVPDGFFKPVEPNVWTAGPFNMIFDPGTGGAEIADTSDIVATLPAASSTVAPYGTFTATTYGETTYNGSTPFDIETTYEGSVDPWPKRPVLLTCEGTTVQIGQYSRTGWQSWESDDDPDWTITIDGTGAALVNDGTDDVLERPAGALRLYDPTGNDWTATAYGETTYGSGDPFSAQTTETRVFPIAGFLYVTLALDVDDEVTGVTGPFFAASLPANSATAVSVPIAYSDGAGSVVQIQLGPIIWRPAP
jgi:hypothetical protein